MSDLVSGTKLPYNTSCTLQKAVLRSDCMWPLVLFSGASSHVLALAFSLWTLLWQTCFTCSPAHPAAEASKDGASSSPRSEVLCQPGA